MPADLPACSPWLAGGASLRTVPGTYGVAIANNLAFITVQALVLVLVRDPAEPNKVQYKYCTSSHEDSTDMYTFRLTVPAISTSIYCTTTVNFTATLGGQSHIFLSIN